jgi:uncharacterized protein
MKRFLLLALAAGLIAAAPPPADLPAAIYTDPPHDREHPARMDILHIPSHGVEINGLALTAAGAGPHPVLIICHGLPGNEKNLDLAQAVRRDGWTVVAFNYRGSWGSPGNFRFAQNIEDAGAVVDYVKGHAAALGIDPHRIVVLGHSMGGWVAVNLAAHRTDLAGLITYSAGDMSRVGGMSAENLSHMMAENRESLAATAEEMSADLKAVAGGRGFEAAAAGLKTTPYLALTSDDGLAAHTDDLVKAIESSGGQSVQSAHVATDHSWSDRRIALEALVINWLNALK